MTKEYEIKKFCHKGKIKCGRVSIYFPIKDIGKKVKISFKIKHKVR